MHWQHGENKLMSKQKCSCNNTFASEPKEAIVKIEQNQQNQSCDRHYGILAKKYQNCKPPSPPKKSKLKFAKRDYS